MQEKHKSLHSADIKSGGVCVICYAAQPCFLYLLRFDSHLSLSLALTRSFISHNATADNFVFFCSARSLSLSLSFSVFFLHAAASYINDGDRRNEKYNERLDIKPKCSRSRIIKKNSCPCERNNAVILCCVGQQQKTPFCDAAAPIHHHTGTIRPRRVIFVDDAKPRAPKLF